MSRWAGLALRSAWLALALLGVSCTHSPPITQIEGKSLKALRELPACFALRWGATGPPPMPVLDTFMLMDHRLDTIPGKRVATTGFVWSTVSVLGGSRRPFSRWTLAGDTLRVVAYGPLQAVVLQLGPKGADLRGTWYYDTENGAADGTVEADRRNCLGLPVGWLRQPPADFR